MPKKKKPYNLTHKIVIALRAIHRGWPPANECLRNSKIETNIHRCEACDKKYRKELMKKDHIHPIGEQPELINGEWSPSWDSYISKFFSPLDNYQALCVECHQVKTKEERRCRK